MHNRCSVELSADAFDRCFWAARQLYVLTKSQNHTLSKVMRSLLDLISAELEAARDATLSNSKCNDAVVTAVIAYMNEHLAHPEELYELARRFGISERHLGRLFGAHLGCSPQRYWLNLRLERACQLLSAGASINEITEHVGFESVRGFQRAFSRSYGTSPSHYRT
jgi:transcriptional regulator GlxA family with amidase domain